MKLVGKVAIVTGAGGAGCGRAIASRFAREGAAVLLADISETGLRDTAATIEAEGLRASVFRTNVAHEEQVRALFEFAETTHGGVDIVVNNASGAVFPEKSLNDWFANLGVDLLGAMYATRYGIEAMRRRGSGAIVNISSTSALPHGDLRAHGPSSSGYNTAKAGIIRLTTSLGWMGQKEKIRVNCLAPHWVGTEHINAIVAAMTPDQRILSGAPNVLIAPEEIAGAVLRLATDESLSGRVVVWLADQPPRLIPFGDPGYAKLEDF
jgi:NAD(P)-dependent dehydrogenase (short-subunit alcohol dehydrogenase family)